MEDQVKGIYGVAVERHRENTDVIEWDEVPYLSDSREDAEKSGKTPDGIQSNTGFFGGSG